MTVTDPCRIGPRGAPSRVVFGPHATNLAMQRAFSPRHVAYYAERARAGAGVVVTETASVHESDHPYARAPLAASCGFGWRTIADACHAHGGLVVASLGHRGLQGTSAYHRRPLWGPSAVADPAERELPVVMERDEISALVVAFADSAALAADAGVDGIEIDAGPRSLVRQFLSGLTNHRTDEYGTRRDLLLTEVLAAVRGAVGDDMIMGLRASCDELAPWAGITPARAAEWVRAVAPLVDYVVPVRGGLYAPDMDRPDFRTAAPDDLCALLRPAAADTLLVGSADDPVGAREALAGGADLVDMTRGLVADPGLVTALRDGRAPRPCVRCNQSCVVDDWRTLPVQCVAHPTEYPSGERETTPWHTDAVALSAGVTVVGGGVAGLEAARLLGSAGVDVDLYERAARLGGVLPAAAPQFVPLVDWLVAECTRAGVRIHTGTPVDDDTVRAASAAGRPVLVAVGAEASRHRFDCDGTVPVVDASVARTSALPHGPVVVFDPRGDDVATDIATGLAAAGRTVALVTPDDVLGSRGVRGGAPPATRAHRAGVDVRVASTVTAATRGAVTVAGRRGGEDTVNCAVVVDCTRPVASPAFASGAGRLRIGDAVAPRGVLDAITDARAAVRALVGGLGDAKDSAAQQRAAM
ncbi:FAD-dependent oxidoreductase [Rhodococcus sp. HNM0569]|uniref:oxidoreductase n=1 Tax=Rhodococcus sp. HNM0569 TaxID=2716340 RepID=UPI00146ED272|nr:FAD-dependent oxidoreductase [Rhodococcus sp. HNM0569]NLU81682.1 NAD(P)-binding protein [Rhodococcus sp. HNM0569]